MWKQCPQVVEDRGDGYKVVVVFLIFNNSKKLDPHNILQDIALFMSIYFLVYIKEMTITRYRTRGYYNQITIELTIER